MEQPESPTAEISNPNGFINRVFNVSLDVENEIGSVCIQETGPGPGPGGQGETQAAPPQISGKDRPEVTRRPRATGGIWKILTRRRAASEVDRRPHSMILPGEASIPKLSFADKVRSFKKLKSPSVFRGRTGKLSSAKFGSSLVDEESFCREFGSPLQSARGTLLRNRGKRHSYAGHTTEFDCSFEDLDPPAPSDSHQPAPVVETVTQNGCKPSEKVTYAKRVLNTSSNCNNLTAGSEEPGVMGSPRAHLRGGRRSKGPDVWSYLRRISLLGKANPAYSERSFDSELHTLDKTMDSDYGSVDFESVRDFQQAPPKHSDSKGHFGGLFKFFNSVAETARKWRTSSRSFSPPEGERSPLGSPRAPQRVGDHVHSVSLTLHSEGHPEPQPTPSSPVTPKPPHSSTFDSVATVPLTDGRSPKVVLKAFRACPGSPTVNGLQCVSSAITDRHTDGQTNHRSIAKVENHISSPGLEMEVETEAEAEVEAEREPSDPLSPEEEVERHSGNEQDSGDAPPDSHQTQETNIQSEVADQESITNSVPASESSEEIFKVSM